MKSNSFINGWEKIVKAKSISGKTEKLESLYLNHADGKSKNIACLCFLAERLLLVKEPWSYFLLG